MRKTLCLFLACLFCFCLIDISARPAHAEADSDQTVLHIACDPVFNFFLEPVIAEYEAVRPDIHIEVHQMDEDELRKSLYSRDDAIDLYVTSSNKANHAYLLSHGLILPIRSEPVENDIKMMYPQIQEYVADSGVFMGYPIYIRANYWTVDEELLQQCGLAVPTTFADYLSMLEQWHQQEFAFSNRAQTGSEITSAFDRIVIAWLQDLAARGERLTFNAPEFQNLLSSLHAASKNGQLGAADAKRSVFHFTGISPVPSYGINTDERYVLTPAVTESSDFSVTAYLDYLVISSKTSQQEEAVAFLEAYLQYGELRHELYPYQVSKLEDNLEKDGQSSKNITFFRQLAAHWNLEAAPLIGALFTNDEPWPLFSQYLNGALTLEQTIAELEILLQDTQLDLATVGWTKK